MCSVMFALLKAACKSRNRKRFMLHLHLLYFDDANPVDSEGNTVAHLCYEHGYIEGVSMLMTEGIETHSLNLKNETPLHLACEKDREAMVEWHLQNNSKDAEYRMKDNRSSYTPSMWLVMNDNVSLLQKFAERGFIDPEAETHYRQNSHFTLALQMDSLDAARFLYDHRLQGKHGLKKPRRGGLSLACDIVLFSKDPCKTFDLLDQWGQLELMTEVDENGNFPLLCCVGQFRKSALLCMVKRGFARPNNETTCSLFRTMSEFERSTLCKLLSSEIEQWEFFLRGFLSLTIRSPSQEKRCAAKRRPESLKNELLRSFDCGINLLVAEFTGISYGKKILYLKELNTFVGSI
jgi:hypothetical protein